MKKAILSLFATISILILASFAYGTDLIGTWQVNYTLTLDKNKPGQTTRSSWDLVVESYSPNAGTFNGRRISKGKVIGSVNGRIIKASPPYRQDLIQFEVLSYEKPYNAIWSGLWVGNGSVRESHFVDTYGNAGTFEIYKK